MAEIPSSINMFGHCEGRWWDRRVSEIGGFQCLPNSRSLAVIDFSVAVRFLKKKLGGSQEKIYIWPIQKVWPIYPIMQQRVSQRMEKCIIYAVEISIKDPRAHLSSCSLEISADDSGPDVLPPVFNNEDAIPGIFKFL